MLYTLRVHIRLALPKRHLPVLQMVNRTGLPIRHSCRVLQVVRRTGLSILHLCMNVHLISYQPCGSDETTYDGVSLHFLGYTARAALPELPQV
jgi:hypothetical protein